MTFIVEENYDRAIDELKNYLEGDSEFPRFRSRVERHIEHCVDLCHAIRAKRKFPGASNLTMAKQQELNDRFRAHFNELQSTLKTIERIHNDLRLEDIRSTVWVIRTFVNCILALAVLAFFLDVRKGLYMTAWLVADDYFVRFTAWIFKLFGF